MRRVISVLVAVLLLCGVGYAVIRSIDPPGVTTAQVRVLIGSEKAEFFNDPEVIEEFKAKGFEVKQQTTGSWTMPTANLDGLDLAFPASRGPAEDIKKNKGITAEAVTPFYSPLVVIAHKNAADALANANLATKGTGPVPWKLQMQPYLDKVRTDTKWTSLQGAAATGELAGDIYLTTTDPTTSSSGALHLAAVSYLENGERVVADDAALAKVGPLLKKLTDKQGDQKTSSDGPFKDFLSGVGNPLVLVYESQVASLVAHGVSTGDLVVLYPDTTVSSDHTAVGLTANGRQVADLLKDDPRLRELEAKHGFRPQADPAAFGKALAGHSDPTFATELSAAGIKQAPVASVAMLGKLVDAAKGK
ncbi:substrate-binding domain-containing protein [Kitasatospora sp. NPDC002040]|uniref:substrate-binding domain-containing protein n=1 Tax=Kitasatospora sp. NPDC002040 TaxID=3154661 RepID=UPI00331E00AB